MSEWGHEDQFPPPSLNGRCPLDLRTLAGALCFTELAVRNPHDGGEYVYLRRGFLKSAAREWMAVCSEHPDVRALVGLARVSQAGGMPDEAASFAREALALDPSHAVARALAGAQPQAVAA